MKQSEQTTDAMADCAMRAAAEYLARNNLTADLTALCECLRAHLKIMLPGALRDARQAMDARTEAWALETFAASLTLAGIEAAKEVGVPRAKSSHAC